MKKLFALGLAAVIAAGAISTTASEAAAKPWGYYPYSGPLFGPSRSFGPRNGATLFFGSPGFSFSFGAPVYRSYPRPFYRTFRAPMYRVSNPHVAWCFRHYPNTYNPATNIYFVKKGVPAVCISPFSY